LIGPNGAGKSTFFKLITGMHLPSTGSIFFQGINLTRMRTYQRVQLGISIKMQTPSIFKNISVRHNLRIALQHHTVPEQLQEEENRLLSLLHLEDDEKSMAGNLSHGQQQWLEIGMALSVKPRLLLMDEPTAGMSPDETFQTGALIQRLNQEGMTIIVVEHDMALVKQIAQQVTVLHFGRIFESGSIDQIINSPEVGEIYLGQPHD